jgi:uridine kinase
VEAMERARSYLGLVAELTAQTEHPLLIAVDGPAGSGKTTFANSLASHLPQSQVVHLDEIYNGWEDALTDSLAANLKSWIVDPFKNETQIKYPVFNWHSYRYQDEKTIASKTSVILEGVGAGNDQVLRDLDFLIWVEADLSIGFERVRKRDGEAVAQQLIAWREKELEWFSQHQTKAKSQLMVDGNPPAKIDLTKEFWPL